MRYFGSLIAVCCFLLAANAAQDDLAKKDFDSLQGVWRLTSFVSDGRPVLERHPDESFFQALIGYVKNHGMIGGESEAGRTNG